MLRQADARYFYYARVSMAGAKVLTEIPEGYEPPELPGEISIQRQISNFYDWAEQRQVKYEGGEWDEGISGAEIPWRRRPGFVRLMEQLQAGDHLVLWRLDRLDRGRGGITSAMTWLAEKGVTLHTLQEYNGEGLDLSSLQGEIMAHIFEIAIRIDTTQRKATQIASIQYFKRIGRSYNGRPGYGRKFITKGKTRKGRPIKWIVWDPYECALIRELYRRVVIEREPLYHVAIDFHERQGGRPCNCGGHWVVWTPTILRKGDQGNPRLARDMLRWYKVILRMGKDIGYSDLPTATEAIKMEPAGLDAMSQKWDLDLETTDKLLGYLNNPPRKKKKATKPKVPKCFQDDGLEYWEAVEKDDD